MSFESIVNSIKAIPPLPQSVLKIEKLFMYGNPNINKIVAIIESDSILTADLLAIVNSPLYSFSKEIVSIHQAVVLFGVNAIRGFVLASISKKSFTLDMSVYNLSTNEFQEISSLQSLLMFQWYMTIDIEQSALLVPIAFLMETGKIIIANEVSKSDYKNEFSQMIKEENSLSQTERLFTGLSSNEVTALLFEHWNFNETFVLILKESEKLPDVKHGYKDFVIAIDVVKTAINVKEVLTEQSIKNATKKLLHYDLEVEPFLRTIKRIQSKMEDI